MRKRNTAFSLVELLIVIALIVLMLGIALPAFNFITGSNSIGSAENQISAFLGRARTEAVGLQEIRGVMFYIDSKTERKMMVLVKESPAKDTPISPGSSITIDSQNNPTVDAWLTLASDSDHIPLPKGVGIEFLNDSSASGEKYIGFNSNANIAATMKIGGVILFDGYGRITSQHYGFRMTDVPTSKSGAPNTFAQLLNPGVSPVTDFAQAAMAPSSSFGFVLFDNATMLDKFGNGYYGDPMLGTPDPNEAAEETWLDQNATAVLINRYNGTLVKAE